LSGAAAFAASPDWLTAHDTEIRELVGRMTLEEKVGQMTQPELGALAGPGDIRSLFLGSVLSGGNSDPAGGNGVREWTATYEACQREALETRLRIPILYGIDAVHGHNNVLGAVIFPHQIGLGCTRDAALVEKVAQTTANEMRATGIQWTFAPCLAVPKDIRWGRTYEGFSEDPAIVSELGAAAVRGFQGAKLGGPDSVVACAKHFVADGGTTFGTAPTGGLLDQGDARIDEKTLRETHLAPYRAAINAGVATIMPSYSSWQGVKCSGNKALLTGLLKKELGFEGFLISDYNAIDQLVPPTGPVSGLTGDNAPGQVETPNYKKCIEISINAGMDMVMVTKRYPEFIRLLQELVREGAVPMARIDDAVTRILRVKFAQGLLNERAALKPSPLARKAFGSPAHREIARQAVRQSLVLLKNNEMKALPLKSDAKRILVAGRGADDLGTQCGGWTIDWQGRRGAVTTGGTTILAALRKAFDAGTTIDYSPDGSGANGADVAVVVVGEAPYAEMHGDRADLSLSAEDVQTVANVKAAGLPVVVVVLSGRPLLLDGVADSADALVAAWLPGTEGDGIADILTGTHSPTGKLSFAWPVRANAPSGGKAPTQSPPIFPMGFGLGY